MEGRPAYGLSFCKVSPNKWRWPREQGSASLTLHWKDAFVSHEESLRLKATAFEFRYRFWVLLAIFALGFTAPWDYWLHLDGSGPNTHVWGRLAITLSRAGMNISAAFNLILALGILC